MPQTNQIKKQDIDTLIELDPKEILADPHTPEEDKQQIEKDIENVRWQLIKENDLNNLTPKEKEKLDELPKDEEKVMEFLNEVYPDFKERFAAQNLIAKRFVLIFRLRLKLLLALTEEKPEKITQIEKLIELAQKDEWEEFLNTFNRK